MRTVHETEALRPSDPVPRNHSNPPPRPQRLKLVLSARPPAGGHADEDDDVPGSLLSPDGYEQRSAYPSDLQLTSEEKTMHPQNLLRLLNAQMQCVEDERAQLAEEVAALEKRKFREWQEKELVLENVMEAEMAFHARRDAGRAKSGSVTAKARQDKLLGMKILPETRLPLEGQLPWWRAENAGSLGVKVLGTLDPEKEALREA